MGSFILDECWIRRWHTEKNYDNLKYISFASSLNVCQNDKSSYTNKNHFNSRILIATRAWMNVCDPKHNIVRGIGSDYGIRWVGASRSVKWRHNMMSNVNKRPGEVFHWSISQRTANPCAKEFILIYTFIFSLFPIDRKLFSAWRLRRPSCFYC